MSEKCPSCNGRGGIGRSVSGVTMSYRICNTCNGEGVLLSESVTKRIESMYIDLEQGKRVLDSGSVSPRDYNGLPDDIVIYAGGNIDGTF